MTGYDLVDPSTKCYAGGKKKHRSKISSV